jgi:hypothetical protein
MNKKQTTLKIPTKERAVFEALAPTEGVTILGGNVVGDTTIVNVKYRDPAYLYYLADNVRKAIVSNSVAVPITSSDKDQKGKTPPPSKSVTDNKNKK